MSSYLSKPQVAARLSVSLSTVERLIREGYIKTERLPGTTLRRISEQALADYLNPPDTGEVVQLRRQG